MTIEKKKKNETSGSFYFQSDFRMSLLKMETRFVDRFRFDFRDSWTLTCSQIFTMIELVEDRCFFFPLDQLITSMWRALDKIWIETNWCSSGWRSLMMTCGSSRSLVGWGRSVILVTVSSDEDLPLKLEFHQFLRDERFSSRSTDLINSVAFGIFYVHRKRLFINPFSCWTYFGKDQFHFDYVALACNRD